MVRVPHTRHPQDALPAELLQDKTLAFDQLSPTEAKGDIIVHNGTNNIRVAIGANGKVLTADSAQASGIKWETAPSGSLSYTKVTIGPQEIAAASSYSANITAPVGFLFGIVDYAKMTVTVVGEGSMPFACHTRFYDGDPDGGGNEIAAIYGGMGSASIPGSGIIEGIKYVPGGSSIVSPVPFKSGTAQLWVKITNEDFSNAGNFTLDLYFRQIVEPA